MDLYDPKTWTDGVGVALLIVGALGAAAIIRTWWVRGTTEKAKRDALQSTIDGRDLQIEALKTLIEVREQRLQLASDWQKVLTTKLAVTEQEVERLHLQAVKKAPPEEIASTAKTTAASITDSVSANTVMSQILTCPPHVRVEPPIRRPDADKPASGDRKEK